MNSLTPSKVVVAYGHTLKLYASVMYGDRWTCDCGYEPTGYGATNLRCWHVIAATLNPRYWPQWVREAQGRAREEAASLKVSDDRPMLDLPESALTAPPPWLSPLVEVARQVMAAAKSQSIAAALNAARGNGAAAVRFVDPSALPAGEPYESFVARTACVPTRDNLHDLFNGLIWLSYPNAKRRLNALHAQQIALEGIGDSRGRLRDALTLFDENAAILHAPAALTDALRQRDWNTLFIEQRAQWESAHLVVFGHALLEKLMRPRKAVTAHVWLVDAVNDDAVASSLDPERLAAKDFLPLPMLGVPGWWPANEDPRFYDDADVFRPQKERKTQSVR